MVDAPSIDVYRKYRLVSLSSALLEFRSDNVSKGWNNASSGTATLVAELPLAGIKANRTNLTTLCTLATHM